MLRSIRWSLQLWHAGILGLALASFGTALYVGFSREKFNRVDSELEAAARILASAPLGQPPNDPNRPNQGRGPGQGGRGPGFRGPLGPQLNNNFGPGGLRGGRGPAGRGGLGRGGLQGQDLAPEDQGNGPNGPIGPGDPWSNVPEDALRRIGENEQDQPYFTVWGLDGTVLRSSSSELDVPTAEDQRLPGSRGPWAGGGDPAFRTRGLQREVILEGPYRVHVLVGKSLVSEQNALLYLRWELLGAGAAVMAIGLCGGWWLSLRATRPIHTISETARAISASDLSRRVDIKESHSELGELATTLNETFDRLQTAFDRQTRFTGDASHELRTPLSVIHSQAELALSRDRTAPEYKKSLETCLRAAKRMKSLVESLLVLARADAGKLVLQREKLDLVEAAEECVAMVQPRAQDKNVSIHAELRHVVIDADRTRIMQLLTNLLSNAVQYNIEGGSIDLRTYSSETEAIISVTDTGVGIPDEMQKRVFERFFRADQTRSREVGGSGLGLAICKSIVEAHGGIITFSSQPGNGTTFLIRLPLISEGTPVTPPNLPPSSPSSPIPAASQS